MPCRTSSSQCRFWCGALGTRTADATSESVRAPAASQGVPESSAWTPLLHRRGHVFSAFGRKLQKAFERTPAYTSINGQPGEQHPSRANMLCSRRWLSAMACKQHLVLQSQGEQGGGVTNIEAPEFCSTSFRKHALPSRRVIRMRRVPCRIAGDQGESQDAAPALPYRRVTRVIRTPLSGPRVIRTPLSGPSLSVSKKKTSQRQQQ